jgi:hypothetical protein
MRRKLSVAVAAIATAGTVAAVANAGAPTIDTDGNFAAIDVALTPPVTGHGVGLDYHGFFGNNRTGQPSKYSGDIALRLPAGMKYNAKLLKARCPLPATAEQEGDASRCPAGSQFGTGDAVVDARPAIAAPLGATIKVYNGALKGGQPTVVLIGKVGGSVSAEVDLVYKKLSGGKFGFELDQIPLPDSDPSAPAIYSFVTFNVRTQNKTVKVKGRRVPILQAPSKCPASGWPFQQQNKTDDGSASIVANDTQPCVKR